MGIVIRFVLYTFSLALSAWIVPGFKIQDIVTLLLVALFILVAETLVVPLLLKIINSKNSVKDSLKNKNLFFVVELVSILILLYVADWLFVPFNIKDNWAIFGAMMVFVVVITCWDLVSKNLKRS